MTIKIKAPRAWQNFADITYLWHIKGGKRVRIVRESDWRKLMALVKAAEKFNEHHMIYEALKSLEKKK